MGVQRSETYGLGDPQMLAKIDKLFGCGVGELVDLPQIVVVGDQSSGKSSVLEGLINKNLPRDSGLCTRFATQIVFRRSSKENISISILPDPNCSTEHRTAAESWGRKDVKSLEPATFAGIMKEVHEVMGVSTPGDDATGKDTFSRDVLRMEISGPEQEHLSVIDVPGIFKNTTPGVTTKDDIALVRKIVLGYMENPRSVMLAVIPANVDVATQEILELAADVDPDGDRTLGVLTKPDLVDEGAESRVVDLVEGRARKTKLGWHVVRNPGQRDLADSSLNRNLLEANFFSSIAPWDAVDPERKGMESLKDRIQEVLTSLVTQEFPQVKQEIIRKFNEASKSFDALGPERSTTAAQSSYLTDLATKYQQLVMLSLEGKIGSNEVFDGVPSLRIASSVTARMAIFESDMANHGHLFRFSSDQAQTPAEVTSKPTQTNTFTPVPHDESFRVRKVADHPEVADILHQQESLVKTSSVDIEHWLKTVYETNRGFELGTFNPSILATTMKKQSSKWSSISLGYVSDVIVLVHKFITIALKAIVPDKSIITSLLSIMLDSLQTQYKRAIEQVDFLLRIELSGTPLTLNHYFNDNLEKSRQDRVFKAMEKLKFHDNLHGYSVRLSDAKSAHPMSNSEHVIQDIHDILRSYYKVARKRFTDNIIKQATDYFLVTGPETPLKLFSPNFVSSLDAGEINHIATEAPRVKRERHRLMKELSSLKEARDILSSG